MKYPRTLSLSATAFVATLALSACSTDPSGTDTGASSPPATQSSEEFNTADVAFATGMIPHHEQAVMMSQIAREQGGPDVVDLANRIHAAQGPEVETMTQWLHDWDGAATGMAGMEG